jgi:hypothetical protein
LFLTHRNSWLLPFARAAMFAVIMEAFFAAQTALFALPFFPYSRL